MFTSDVGNAAITRSRSREDLWLTKIRTAVSRLTIKAPQHRILNALLFDDVPPAYLPYSNQHVRCASRQAVLAAFARYQQRRPDERLFLATFAGERGVCLLDRPHFDSIAFQRAIDAVMRRFALEGLFFAEFDIVKPVIPAEGHWVTFHYHGIVRPQHGPISNLRAIQAELAASKAFPAWNQLPHRPGAHFEPIGCGKSHVENVAAYCQDPFHQLKRLQPDPETTGSWRLRSTRKGLNSQLTLRAAEIQSLMPLRDMVFGVGHFGTRQRRRWWQHLTTALPERDQSIEIADAARLWQSIRPAWSRRDWDDVVCATRSSLYRTEIERADSE